MNLTKASTAVAGVAAAVALALAANVEAVLITNGFTFAVASEAARTRILGRTSTRIRAVRSATRPARPRSGGSLRRK